MPAAADGNVPTTSVFLATSNSFHSIENACRYFLDRNPPALLGLVGRCATSACRTDHIPGRPRRLVCRCPRQRCRCRPRLYPPTLHLPITPCRSLPAEGVWAPASAQPRRPCPPPDLQAAGMDVSIGLTKPLLFLCYVVLSVTVAGATAEKLFFLR